MVHVSGCFKESLFCKLNKDIWLKMSALKFFLNL
jgi:hypothetical protein